MTNSDNHTSQKWYKNIPDRWASHRIKALLNLRDERNYLPLSDVNLISLYTDIGVRQHSDIEHTTGNKARNANGYKIVYQDDIVVNILLCWMGAIGRSDYHGVTSPAYDVYTPKQGVNSHYFHYLFRTPLFSQQCYKVGKGIMSMRWRTYSPQFRNIEVPLPPPTEQEKIVRFLDWKVSEINKLIAIKKKQIISYKELVSAEIELQLHMYPVIKILRLKSLGRFEKGGGFSRDNLLESNGCPAILYGDIYTQYTYKTNIITHMIDVAAYNNAPKISKGDIVLAGTGETKDEIGKPILYYGDETVAAGGDVIIFHTNSSVNAEYLLFQLYSQNSLHFRYIKGKGDIIVHIYPKDLGNTTIPMIASENQKKVVKAINLSISRIDKIITMLKSEIDILHEFKIRLISDVVTGQIDVRDIEIPDYEFVEETTDTYSGSEDEQEYGEEQED